MPNASPKEVSKAAAAKGMKITPQHVSVVRSKDKGGKKTPGRPKGSKNKPGRKANGASDLLQFKQLVVKIGLPAAERYLQDLRSSVGL